MVSPSKSSTSERSNTIYLVGIPAEQNKISELGNYFGKFGTVLNVEVAHNCDPSAAKVTFATNEEADAAFNSREAVLNNRLIVVSWKYSQAKAASASMSPVATANAGESDDTKCTLCDKTFASKWHRDWHIKRMHDGSGINCEICNTTFATVANYKKHCFAKHPTAESVRNETPKKMIKCEHSPMDNFDHFTLVRQNELLRIKIKSLKENSKDTEREHYKELKKKKKRFEQQLKEKDDSLKEKDIALATMQQQLTMLETTNTRLMQDVQNGRMEVKMLHDTLIKVCGTRSASR